MIVITEAIVIMVMVITMTGMPYWACCVYGCYAYDCVVFAVVLYKVALHYIICLIYIDDHVLVG